MEGVQSGWFGDPLAISHRPVFESLDNCFCGLDAPKRSSQLPEEPFSLFLGLNFSSLPSRPFNLPFPPWQNGAPGRSTSSRPTKAQGNDWLCTLSEGELQRWGSVNSFAIGWSAAPGAFATSQTPQCTSCMSYSYTERGAASRTHN